MSKDVENKVVSLEFDNSKFEKPAKETLSTLDKLKQALSFKGVSDGIDKMSRSIKAVSFAPIEKGIDSVYAKFTFLERFTINLYDRLSNKIIDFGQSIVRETFKTPISSGKSEYELKMGSIQTIMASTGEKLEVVNKYLDELNKYSDDTIYSFSDMTNNIGKFTNAGVKLEDAVAAIKGISNEAAMSGANAQEASRAMYNFAQALSAGYVKLIDWKSIENANMATVKFKEQLMETAVELNVLTKETNGYKTAAGHTFTATQNFNEYLKDEWMTTEVLIETLKRYADGTKGIGKEAQAAATEVKTFTMMMDTLKEALQSGWAESWQHIIGDFEKAKDLWTKVSGVLGSVIERINTTRNNMLKVWETLGGRMSMIQSFSNLWSALTKILGTVRDAFRVVFPPMTGSRLADLTKMIENFTRKLIPGTDKLDNLRNTFKGLFSVLGIGVDIAKALFKAFEPLFGKAFKFLSSEILEASGGLGQWLFNLRKSIREGKVFENVFTRLATVLSYVGIAFRKVYYAMKDIIMSFKEGGIRKGISAIGDAFAELFKNIWEFLKEYNPITLVYKLGKEIAKTISKWPIGEAIVDMLRSIRDTIANSPVWKFCVSVVEGFVDLIQKGINKLRGVDTTPADDMANNVKKSFGPLEALKNFFTAIWHGIVAVWNWAAPTLKALGSQIKDLFVNLFSAIKGVFDRSDLGDAGAFMAGASLATLIFQIRSFIKNIKDIVFGGNSVVKGFKKMMNGVTNVLKAVTINLYAKSIKDVAIAIGILAGELFIVSALPPDAIARSTAAIMLLFKGLASSVTSFNALSAISGGRQGAGIAGALAGAGMQILAIAIAVGVLVANMAILAFIPYERLLKGLATIVLLMRAISSEAIRITKNGGTARGASVIIALAAFLSLLVVPIAILSLIAHYNTGGLWGAVGAIAVLMAVVSGLTVLLQWSSSKWGTKVPKMTSSIVGVTVALIGIASALAALMIVCAIVKKWTGNNRAFAEAGIFIISALKQLAKLVVSIIAAYAMGNAIASKISSIQVSGAKAYSKVTSFSGVNESKNKVKNYSTSGGKAAFTGLGVFGSIAATLIGIGVAIAAISASVAILATVRSMVSPQTWGDITEFMSKVILGVTAIFAMAAIIGSISKGNTNIGTGKINAKIALFPSYVSFAIAASVAVLAISAAAKLLSGVESSTIWHAIGIVAAVSALLGVFAALSGNFPKFAKGLRTVSTVFERFSRAAMWFALSIAVIIAAISLFTKATDKGLDDFVANLKAHEDDIINAVAMLIDIALRAAIKGIASALLALTEETIVGLGKVLDALIKEAPSLLAKIFTLIGQILDGITDKAGEITEKLVTALIAVIDGLAKAIDRHKYEIIEAINALIESILKVIAGLFARLWGVTKEGIDDFVNDVVPYLKKAFTLIVGAIAIEKLLTAVNTFKEILSKGRSFAIDLAGHFKTLAHHIKESRHDVISYYGVMKDQTGKDILVKMNEEWVASGNIITYLQKKFTGLKDTIINSLKGIGNLIKSHPYITALIAVGVTLKGVFDILSANTDVITENDKLATESAKRMYAAEKEYQDLIGKRNEELKIIDRTTETIEDNYLPRLRECVDANGKLKEGYENQFAFIKGRLAGTIELIVDEETGRVQAIDQYNNKLDIQSEKLDEIIKKKQMQAKIEKAADTAEEARAKLKSGELLKAKTNAEKEKREFLAQDKKIEGLTKTNKEWVELYNAYRQMTTQQGKSRTDAMKELFGNDIEIRFYDDALKRMNDVYALSLQYDSEIDSAETIIKRYTAIVNNYDQAVTQLDGSTKGLEKALAVLTDNLVLKESGATLTDLEAQFLNAKNTVIEFGNAGISVSDNMKTNWEATLSTLAGEIKTFGEEGVAFLNEYGNTGGDSYVNAFYSRLRNNKLILNDVLGVMNGSGSLLDRLYKLGEMEAEYHINGYKKTSDQHSPSKKWAEMGINDIMGLIQGVEKQEGLADKTYSTIAAANMATYAAAAAKESSKYQFSPMINTSGIQNGTNYIRSQLSSLQNGQIDTSLTSRLAASIDSSKIDAGNEKIVNAITDLRSDMDGMLEVLSNLKVVMDTGATVGALAPAMDTELGRRTTRKVRGV